MPYRMYNSVNMETTLRDIFEEAEKPILITERMFNFAEFLYGGRFEEEEETKNPTDLCLAIPHDNHVYEVDDPLSKYRRTVQNQNQSPSQKNQLEEPGKRPSPKTHRQHTSPYQIPSVQKTSMLCCNLRTNSEPNKATPLIAYHPTLLNKFFCMDHYSFYVLDVLEDSLELHHDDGPGMELVVLDDTHPSQRSQLAIDEISFLFCFGFLFVFKSADLVVGHVDFDEVRQNHEGYIHNLIGVGDELLELRPLVVFERGERPDLVIADVQFFYIRGIVLRYLSDCIARDFEGLHIRQRASIEPAQAGYLVLR